MSLQRHEKCKLEICFALFTTNNVYLVLSSRILFPVTLHPIFKKWVGLFNPSYFVEGREKSHGIALTITELMISTFNVLFSFLFATVFN